jgi:hypothetical protein
MSANVVAFGQQDHSGEYDTVRSEYAVFGVFDQYRKGKGSEFQ